MRIGIIAFLASLFLTVPAIILALFFLVSYYLLDKYEERKAKNAHA